MSTDALKNCLLICIIGLSVGTCAAPSDSRVNSDQTNESLQKECRDAFDETVEARAALCECVAEYRPNQLEPTCGDGGLVDRWMNHMRKTLQEQRPRSFHNEGCLSNLQNQFLTIQLDRLISSCEETKGGSTEADLLSLEDNSQSCWRMVGMNEDRCVIASPCAGPNGANTADLPIHSAPVKKLFFSESDLAAFQANRTIGRSMIKLCHPRLTEIHRQKDEANGNLQWNEPFANLLTFGRTAYAPPGGYGPSNCHGTADALSGFPLASLKIDQYVFDNIYVEKACAFTLPEKPSALRVSDLYPIQKSTDDALSISTTGLTINMNHSESCSENECGDIKLRVQECSGTGQRRQVKGYIMIESMCRKCWAKTLVANGFKQFSDEALTLDAIKPGCILTTSDHSITHLYSNSGMCYYFESTSPFGPPQLRVDTCTRYLGQFEQAWCPSLPLVFHSDHLD